MAGMIDEIKRKTNELIETGRGISNELHELEERQKTLISESELAKTEYDRIKISGSSDEIKQAEAKMKVAEKSVAAGQRALDNAHKKEEQNKVEKGKYIREIDKYSQIERVNAEKAGKLKGKAFGENGKAMTDSFIDKVNQAEDSKNQLLQSLGLESMSRMIENLDGVQTGYESFDLEALLLEFLGVDEFAEAINVSEEIIDQYRKELIELGIEDDFYLEQCLNEERAKMYIQLSEDVDKDIDDYREFERVDISELVKRISEEKERRSKIVPLFDDAKREEFRNKINEGVYTEKDVIAVGQTVIEDYNHMMGSFFATNDVIMLKINETKREYKNTKIFNFDQREILKDKLKKQGILLNRLNMKSNSEGVMREVVAAQRPVGSNIAQKIIESGVQSFDEVEVVRELNNVRAHIPTDWCNKLNEKGIYPQKVRRGFYREDEDYDYVSLSYNRTYGSARCAYHELGHALTHRYPEIAEIETQFYNRRTEGYDLKPMPGYSRREKARKDHFTRLYMGKEYEDGSHEIVSMGMEGMYCGTNYLYKDPEYQALMLGLLTAI